MSVHEHKGKIEDKEEDAKLPTVPYSLALLYQQFKATKDKKEEKKRQQGAIFNLLSLDLNMCLLIFSFLEVFFSFLSLIYFFIEKKNGRRRKGKLKIE